MHCSRGEEPLPLCEAPVLRAMATDGCVAIVVISLIIITVVNSVITVITVVTISFSRTCHLQAATHTNDNGGYRSVAHQAMAPRESSRNELSMEAHTTQGIKSPPKRAHPMI